MKRRWTIMVQGTLFQYDGPGAVPSRLTEEDIICAVAVSIVSSPAGNGIWNMISSRMPPGEIYRAVCRRERPLTQEYLCGAYSTDPLEAAKMITEQIAEKSIRVLTFWDVDYPALLKEIQCPPAVLYVKGNVPAGPAVSIVGARKADARSSAIARRIAREMAACGFTVVSGMAVGIDREAHLGAIDAGGPTVGVLANGIDIAYPWRNRDLYRMIESSRCSALVSEYPPGIFAGKWTFVRRNRIISGLGAGTVVVKAGDRSGALITARHAMEQNRDVFACTGNSFDEEFAGCHRLIRSGAVLVTCTEDIIDELSRNTEAVKRLPGPGADHVAMVAADQNIGEEPGPGTLARRVLDLLAAGDQDIDAIARNAGGNPGEVNEAVVYLELCGRITRSGNMISLI
jgi:DNA processing protein